MKLDDNVLAKGRFKVWAKLAVDSDRRLPFGGHLFDGTSWWIESEESETAKFGKVSRRGDQTLCGRQRAQTEGEDFPFSLGLELLRPPHSKLF